MPAAPEPAPTLRSRSRILPHRPGVYLFKGAGGRVLYVGKARSLRARVSQYADAGRLDPAKREMVRHAADVETIVTTNEREALALEATLIQRHAPPYNVRLVDDSSYLYVRIARDTVPRVELVRRVQPDGAWYRGPYPVASAIRTTLREARKLFPWCAKGGQRSEVRSQKSSVPTSDLRHPISAPKPCFAYHLGLCPGICARAVSVEEYQRIIEGLKRFLDGNIGDAVRTLREQMAEASRAERFEHAAKLRDATTAIENATTPQHVATARSESVDVIGIARYRTHAVAAVLSVRQGRLVGSRVFPLITPAEETTPALLRSFLLAYLPRAADPTPPSPSGRTGLRGASGAKEMLLPELVEDAKLLENLSGTPVHFTVPQRGWKRRLLDLARTNAEEALARTQGELTSPAALEQALSALASALGLTHPPRRIEAYDVSNIQGRLPTASMVAFVDGRPRRSEYRKFKIATKETPNDVAMMREVLRRRFGKHVEPHGLTPVAPRSASPGGEGRNPSEASPTSPSGLRGAPASPFLPGLTLGASGRRRVKTASDWPPPDLVILDGGKGQLRAGVDTLNELGLTIPLAALAKREEELFLPGQKNSLVLDRASPALYLLQRLRDEAHRFTLGYHHLLRKKRMTRSILEEIPGVGDTTRKKLLRAFGSLREIRAATEDDLRRVVGTTLARTIRAWLTGVETNAERT